MAIQCFAPTDLYHVMVETPIPAGTEPVDPNLSAVTPDFYYGLPELKPVNTAQGGWYDWTPSFTDYRDDKVTLFATYLPAGTYEYTFQVARVAAWRVPRAARARRDDVFPGGVGAEWRGVVYGEGVGIGDWRLGD